MRGVLQRPRASARRLRSGRPPGSRLPGARLRVARSSPLPAPLRVHRGGRPRRRVPAGGRGAGRRGPADRARVRRARRRHLHARARARARPRRSATPRRRGRHRLRRALRPSPEGTPGSCRSRARLGNVAFGVRRSCDFFSSRVAPRRRPPSRLIANFSSATCRSCTRATPSALKTSESVPSATAERRSACEPYASRFASALYGRATAATSLTLRDERPTRRARRRRSVRFRRIASRAGEQPLDLTVVDFRDPDAAVPRAHRLDSTTDPADRPAGWRRARPASRRDRAAR